MNKAYVILLLFIFLLTGCSSRNVESVSITECNIQQVAKQYSFNGIVVAKDKPLQVYSDLSGYRIKSVCVSVGDIVKKGDVLCYLDTSDIEKESNLLEQKLSLTDDSRNKKIMYYKNNISYIQESCKLELEYIQDHIDLQQELRDVSYSKYCSLSNEHDTIKSELTVLQNQMDLAQNDSEFSDAYKAYKEKNKTFEAIAQEMNKYFSQYEDAKKECEELEYEKKIKQNEYSQKVNEAQNELDEFLSENDNSEYLQLENLNENIQKSTILAPEDGVISVLFIEEGKTTSDEAIAEISKVNEYQLRTTVSDEYVLNLNEGDNVSYSIPGISNETGIGIISKIFPIRGDEGYDIYVNMNDKPQNIMLGMTVSVTITVESSEGLTVPNSSLIKTNNEFIVFTLSANENGSYTAVPHKVNIKLSGSLLTIIESSEIKQGDKIITNPNVNLAGKSIIPNEEIGE